MAMLVVAFATLVTPADSITLDLRSRTLYLRVGQGEREVMDGVLDPKLVQFQSGENRYALASGLFHRRDYKLFMIVPSGVRELDSFSTDNGVEVTRQGSKAALYVGLRPTDIGLKWDDKGKFATKYVVRGDRLVDEGVWRKVESRWRRD